GDGKDADGTARVKPGETVDDPYFGGATARDSVTDTSSDRLSRILTTWWPWRPHGPKAGRNVVRVRLYRTVHVPVYAD
ncbi:hypothetical protein, partial [Streptomyces sp900116325]|uniref:hypothetical protein n=1 Tax=Streptomyces sp. 900116325 TaxID=3154295 RepID=UPI00339F92F4